MTIYSCQKDCYMMYKSPTGIALFEVCSMSEEEKNKLLSLK